MHFRKRRHRRELFLKLHILFVWKDKLLVDEPRLDERGQLTDVEIQFGAAGCDEVIFGRRFWKRLQLTADLRDRRSLKTKSSRRFGKDRSVIRGFVSEAFVPRRQTLFVSQRLYLDERQKQVGIDVRQVFVIGHRYKQRDRDRGVWKSLVPLARSFGAREDLVRNKEIAIRQPCERH